MNLSSLVRARIASAIKLKRDENMAKINTRIANYVLLLIVQLTMYHDIPTIAASGYLMIPPHVQILVIFISSVILCEILTKTFLFYGSRSASYEV